MTLRETLSYEASRERFRRQAQASGWQLTTFTPASSSLGTRRPRGDAEASGFSLDVAWRGPDDASQTLLVTAGLHGVEGYFGSSLLLDWFRAAEKASATSGASDLRMVAVHCLNPFGYTHRRRANEQNIDLNRNFLLPAERYGESPAFDPELDALMHPREPPGRGDWFRLRLALMAARRGPRSVQQSIAGGQSSNAQGLFFGGFGPSPFVAWCETYWAQIVGPSVIEQGGRTTHFDLHSGLGTHGTLKLLLQPGIDSAGIEEMRKRFGAAAVAPPPGEGSSPKKRGIQRRGVAARGRTAAKDRPATAGDLPYQARGTWGRWLQHRFRDQRYEYACAEFGTYGPIQVLAALRGENIAWHQFGPGSAEHERAANRLRDAFYPPSTRWRATVRAKFLSLISAATRDRERC